MGTDGGKVSVFVVYSTRSSRCRPHNIPVSPTAVFGFFIFLGSRKGKEPREDDRQARVLLDFVPLPLRRP